MISKNEKCKKMFHVASLFGRNFFYSLLTHRVIQWLMRRRPHSGGRIAFIFLCTILFGLAGGHHVSAAILFSDNFNYSDSFNNHGWSAGPTSSILTGAGPDGTNSLKILFNCDSNNCGDRWHNWDVPANTQELWIKFKFKLDCGVGSCIGGAKFIKLFGIRSGSNYANETFAIVYGTGLFENASFGCNGDTRDTDSNLKYGTQNTWDMDPSCAIVSNHYGDDIDARDGQWHTWKIHMKYSDNGIHNGITEVWYDGAYAVKAINQNNRSDNNSKYFDYLTLGGWNQSYGGQPYSILYDDFVAANSDPDLTPDTTPPAAPSGLAVE